MKELKSTYVFASIRSFLINRGICAWEMQAMIYENTIYFIIIYIQTVIKLLLYNNNANDVAKLLF